MRLDCIPDTYMNELLVGMRTMHQVLLDILKKLEVNDFKLDGSDLYLDTRLTWSLV
jgi:hypothetical protein